jgi:hypothetical protein
MVCVDQHQPFNFLALHRQEDLCLVWALFPVENKEIVVKWILVNVVPESFFEAVSYVNYVHVLLSYTHRTKE